MGENCRDCGYFKTQKSQSICDYGNSPCLASGNDEACKYFTDRPKGSSQFDFPEQTVQTPAPIVRIPIPRQRPIAQPPTPANTSGSVRTLAELVEVKQRGLNYRVTFGRWRGRSVNEVPAGYIIWAERTIGAPTTPSSTPIAWYCECGQKLRDTIPDSDAEFVLECPRCGRDHSQGT